LDPEWEAKARAFCVMAHEAGADVEEMLRTDVPFQLKIKDAVRLNQIKKASPDVHKVSCA
jgi:hypothetical protein